jgi:phosphoribosylanthranilate isomerase
MFIKVCGLTSREHIDWAVDLGYSAVGIVLHPGSVRFCGRKEARALARYAGNRIARVAVGISFNEVGAVYDEFDFVQLYEYKKMDRLIAAGTQLPAGSGYAYFLYDASRGSGEFDHLPSWLLNIKSKLILSGGLNVHNVMRVIHDYRPFGVDVSSGVEAEHGMKDYLLMKNFIAEVKNAVE